MSELSLTLLGSDGHGVASNRDNHNISGHSIAIVGTIAVIVAVGGLGSVP